MKKVSFLFAMVFIVTFSMAQNTATTTQSGNSNGSDIEQNGNMQTAVVTQTGDNNDVDVDQYAESSSYGLGEQSASVSQTGNQNDASVEMDQTGGGGKTINTAVLDQIGNWNESDQKINTPGYNSGASVTGYQEGNYNDLDQIIYNGYTTSQSATQLGNNNIANQKSWGAYKDLDILTDGNYNEAIQSANGAKADLNINQLGDRNYAKQQFEGSFAFSANNTGDIVQTGNWNDARQFMNGGTEGNDLDGFQLGSNNYSNQSVNGNFNINRSYVVGNDNDIRISQVGDENNVDVAFNSAGIGLSSANDVDVTQDGSYNYLLVRNTRGDVGGDNNKVDVDHEGNGQYHRVYIDGSGNDIRIDASGNVGGSQYDGNRGDWSFQDDYPLWNERSDNNELDLIQSGSDNFATGSVSGDSNEIDIRQTGTGNMVGTAWYNMDGLVISGNSNIVDIDQLGIGNSSMNTVTGNGNNISVFQSN